MRKRNEKTRDHIDRAFLRRGYVILLGGLSSAVYSPAVKSNSELLMSKGRCTYLRGFVFDASSSLTMSICLVLGYYRLAVGAREIKRLNFIVIVVIVVATNYII